MGLKTKTFFLPAIQFPLRTRLLAYARLMQTEVKIHEKSFLLPTEYLPEHALDAQAC